MFCFSLLNAVCLLSLWFSFCGPFLWSILAFLICGNCLQTLQNVLQEMGNRITILGSIKHPTPYRMAKNVFMSYFNPYALGAPASDVLSVFEKKEDKKNYAILSFYLSYINSSKKVWKSDFDQEFLSYLSNNGHMLDIIRKIVKFSVR